MPRAGRRRSVVWACFVENAASGKRRALCRFCQHDLVANPIRMVRHIVKHCPSADEQHKKICREYQALTVPLRRRGDGDGDIDGQRDVDEAGADVDLAGASANASHAADAMHHEFHQQQQHDHHQHAEVSAADDAMSLALATHAVAHLPRAADASPAPPSDTTSAALPYSRPLDEDLVQRVHEDLALALATTEGSALRVLENPRFVRTLELLHVPQLTATEIESRVAPRLRERVEAHAMAVLGSATTITVQLTAALAVAPGTVGVDVYASDQDHRQVSLGNLSAPSATELMPLIRARIRAVPRKHGCALHVCTDAFAVPPSVAAALNDKQPAPLTTGLATGCLVQASLSLLAKVVTTIPRLRHVVDACAYVNACVAADDSLWAHLQSHSDCTSEITATRFDDSRLWSLLAAVDQVMRLRHVLRDVAPSAIHAIVASDQFWRDAALAQDLLRPFGFLIALSEAGQLSSSMVLTSWLLVWATALRAHALSAQETQAIASAVLTHIQRHASAATLVCVALDPRCRGVALIALGKRKVRALALAAAQQLDPEVNPSALLEQVVKYLNGEQPFDDEASWQMMASLPRLFWVEYAAETPELSALALASLSVRPFIHSLERTWELAPAGHRLNVSEGVDEQHAALKSIALGLDLMDKETSDRRKHGLAATARVLVPDAASAAEGSFVLDGAPDELSYTSALPSDSPAEALWTRLALVAEAFNPVDGSQDDSHNATPSIDVEAAWFAVDAPDAVAQLQASLHRALFAEFADLRGDAANAHHEDAATRHAAITAAATATEESATEILTGLEGL